MPKKFDYSDWSSQDLINRITELEKRIKYGLVWDEEREPEKIVEECKTKLPVLKEVKSKEIKTNSDKPTHILIEGDNYHALSVLNYTHQNAIDVIYIDPPYNTGAKDWTYNNNYVDDSDSYRHSKWLSLMKHRLILAKNLLKEDGILCVTIDDYEVHRLWCLLDEIFGENNHLGTLVIRNNPSGRSTVKGVSISHEYALLFGKTSLVKVGRLPRNKKQIERYDQKDEIGAFEWVNFRKHGGIRIESPRMFYPFYLRENLWRIPKMNWNQSAKQWDVLEHPQTDETVVYPVDDNSKERRWKWAFNTVLKNKNEFKEVFLNENRWYAIRVHSSMIPKIKYIAAYQVAPVSAITHVAKVSSIETWKETNKYIVYFLEPAKKIKSIKLIPKSIVKAPQAPRYTSYKRLIKAKNMDEVF